MSDDVGGRRQCCEFLMLMMQLWPTQTLERHVIVLHDAIKRGINDPDSEARGFSRRSVETTVTRTYFSLNCLLLNMNLTNETLLFDRFFKIMYNLCVFTCIILIFVFYCTHVRMSYVLNFYLLTYLLTSDPHIS